MQTLRNWFRKLFLLTMLLVMVAGGLFIAHVPILQGMGKALIYETPLERCDVMFIMGGSPYDRGRKAAELFQDNRADRIVCLGANVPPPLRVLDRQWSEAELTGRQLHQSQVPQAVIQIVAEGTSTYEECQLIRKYCQDEDPRRVMVVSSRMHTRRIFRLLNPVLRSQAIRLCMQGAEDSRFDPERWWESEDGLIFVFVEWVKTGYYWLKYRPLGPY